MHRRLSHLTVLLSVLILTAVASPHSVVTLYPTADAHVRDVAPNENNGASEVLWIGRGVFWNLGNIRTFVHFDLDLLGPDPSAILAASLSAFQHSNEPAAGGLDTDVHFVLAPWQEDTVTWANQPAHDPQRWATAQTGGGAQNNTWIDWDVTDLLRARLTEPNDGWMFRNRIETAGASRLGYFHSREHMADPSRRIQLNVEIPVGTSPVMTLSYDRLTAGERTTVVVTGAAPNEEVFLGYSIARLGGWPVPRLGVRLGIHNPRLAGSAMADASGRAVFSTTIPRGASGQALWIQAAARGKVSNIMAGRVE